ncbi:MAG: hypothetical protein OEZ00_07640 [Dehalococcoidia bacterium]|nr:hypothetical protein [Dehalococcoidia bacterium]
MADIVGLSKQDINGLFDAMGEELTTHSSEITFVQIRLSAERFVVPLCGLAAERILNILKPNQYHVHFEKRLRHFKQGPIDLILIPITKDGKEDWNTPCCFEFKMVWSKGIKDNVLGIKNDIEKMGGYYRGYVVAVLFSFNGGPAWAPYAHKGDMEWLVKEVVAEIGKPVYQGKEYRIAGREVEGKLKLIAWAAGIRDSG